MIKIKQTLIWKTKDQLNASHSWKSFFMVIFKFLLTHQDPTGGLQVKLCVHVLLSYSLYHLHQDLQPTSTMFYVVHRSVWKRMINIKTAWNSPGRRCQFKNWASAAYNTLHLLFVLIALYQYDSLMAMKTCFLNQFPIMRNSGQSWNRFHFPHWFITFLLQSGFSSSWSDDGWVRSDSCQSNPSRWSR